MSAFQKALQWTDFHLENENMHTIYSNVLKMLRRRGYDTSKAEDELDEFGIDKFLDKNDHDDSKARKEIEEHGIEKFLKKRGYDVEKARNEIRELGVTKFYKKYRKEEEKKTFFHRSKLNRKFKPLVSEDSEKNETVYVFFLDSESKAAVKSSELEAFMKRLKEEDEKKNPIVHFILITREPLGDLLLNSKLTKEVRLKNGVEMFTDSDFLYDPLEFFLSPQYQILREEERDQYLRNNHISLRVHPIMNSDDQISRYFLLNNQEIVRVQYHLLGARALVKDRLEFRVAMKVKE